jgi:glucose-1-phosphate cytidylyltransferase
MFLANYGDTVTDVNLPAMIEQVKTTGAMGSFVAVRPNYSFHVVAVNDDGHVREISDVTRSDMWINGGYFVMRSAVLDDLHPGEELVNEPFQRLIAKNQLLAHRHEGFWAPMDTLKEKQWLESLHESGEAPWQLWNENRGLPPRTQELVSA